LKYAPLAAGEVGEEKTLAVDAEVQDAMLRFIEGQQQSCWLSTPPRDEIIALSVNRRGV